MATTYTPAARLAKPGVADRNWNVPLNANADRLDALAPIGGLCVSPAEVPSVSLNVQVAPGAYRRPDGTVASFAGAPATAVGPAQTTYLYLSAAGELAASTAGYPAAVHVPLAAVTAGAAAIEAVRDDRVCLAAAGPGSLPYLPLTGGTLADGANLALGTASGTRLGTAASQKLAFWGAAPSTRPGPFTQVYATASHTLGAYTPVVQTTAFTGIASGQPGSPYAQVADLNSLRAAYENLRLLAENLAGVLNALIDDLQAIGLVG